MGLRELLLPDEGLETDDAGFTVSVTLPRYRSLPLSSIEPLGLWIDDREVEPSSIKFEVNGHSYRLSELPEHFDEWWFVSDRARLRVACPGGLAMGMHDVEFAICLRLPYGTSEGDMADMRREVIRLRKRLDCRAAVRYAPIETTGIRVGVTLYSFTPQFQQNAYGLGQLIERVAAMRLGPGLEIVGFQSLRGFPVVPGPLGDWFRDVVRASHLQPSCLDANVDVALRRDRRLTDDELFEYLCAQIAVADQLGFPVVRMQYDASPDMMERLAPVAERRNIKLGVEIHAPHSVNHPTMLALRERFERVGSPMLGFIPDFGASVRRVPQVFLDAYRRRGVPDDVIRMVVDAWLDARSKGSDPFQASRWLSDRLDSKLAGDEARSLAWHTFLYFGYQSPDAWLEVAERTFHVHAKFFEFDRDGREPTIDYPRLVSLFNAAGYTGYFSSEYEGWQWEDSELADAFSRVQTHQRLLGRATNLRSSEGTAEDPALST